MKRFDRILKIFFLLQSKSMVTNEDLQQYFGISRRTIYRDLQSLAEAGIPVVNESGTGYSLMEGFKVQPPRFTQHEMLGLLVAEKIMQQHETVFIKQHFEAAIIKIKSSFLQHQKAELLQLENNLSFNLYLKPGIYLPNIIDQLVNSILTKKTVVLHYHKPYDSKPKDRKIEPAGVYFHNYYWYVIAWCHLRQDYRDFRLDRIKNIQQLNDRFTQQHPPLEELRAKRSTTNITAISISVQQEFAHFLFSERPLYGFTHEEITGRNIRMHFKCTYHPTTFARWLLKFVDIAKIIEPVSLQQELKQILQAGIRNNKGADAKL